MGTYKARENNQEENDQPKSYEEQKQESTEKAVNLAGEGLLNSVTGGTGGKIKNMAEKVPVLGGAVKKTWDGAVKNVSNIASRTPVGDILKKADDAGVTDAVNNINNAISMKNGQNIGVNNSNKNNTDNSKDDKKSKNKTPFNFFGDSSSGGGLFNGSFNIKISSAFKVKLVLIGAAVFMFFIICVAVFANDDMDNLALTNDANMSSKDGERACTQEEVEDRLVYVGDTRVSGMKDAISKDNINYISGNGYEWLNGDGLSKLDEVLQNKSDAIVILSSGINDLNNIDNYIASYKNLMSKYPDAKIYVMSVNPVDETKTDIKNNQIEGFNKKLSENFGANYIDSYSNMSSVTSSDGVLYDSDTYNSINNYVTNSLINSNGIRCGFASGNVVEKLKEVSNWFIGNIKTYQRTPCGGKGSGKRKYYENPFLSRNIGDDCTEFAGVFMSYVCGSELPESYSGAMVNISGSWAKSAEACGWKAYTTDEIGELQAGDVLIADNSISYSIGAHAEVYVDESHTFGWGMCHSEFPIDNTISKETRGGHTVFSDSYEKNPHKYVTVYRYMNSTDNSTSNLNAKKMNDVSFNHGTKTKENQKYIMLHDTEIDTSPENIVNSWANSKNGVAAHFVVGRDGSIVQAVELDVITHHAGFGGPGNYDSKFGVGNNDKKGNGDDLVGQNSNQWNGYTSYGMNSYSIGIEMVHVGGQDYPEVQLNAVDKVIAYIDAYYGKKSTIIDHKDWRPSNSDTDSKFATYLSNYKSLRHH